MMARYVGVPVVGEQAAWCDGHPSKKIVLQASACARIDESAVVTYSGAVAMGQAHVAASPEQHPSHQQQHQCLQHQQRGQILQHQPHQQQQQHQQYHHHRQQHQQQTQQMPMLPTMQRRRWRTFLRIQAAPPPVVVVRQPWVPPALVPPPVVEEVRRAPEPLSPKQLEDFVKNGYCLLWPDVPGGAAFHEQICHTASRIAASDEVGNNLMAEDVCPDDCLSAILDSPEIVGALTTLLGEDYAMLSSRHCHMAKPGSPGQGLHQDDFHGMDGFRHMAPNEVMIFYYPQAVSPLMGPTAVLPGSQYSRRSGPAWRWTPSGRQDAGKKVTLDRPGGCMLMHWHLWHHGTPQLGGDSVPVRYAFKFQFRRTRPFDQPPALMQAVGPLQNPFLEAPDVACEPAEDLVNETHRATCAAVWSAICGETAPQSLDIAIQDARHRYRGAALRVASGVWPSEAAVVELVSALCSPGSLEASQVEAHQTQALQLTNGAVDKENLLVEKDVSDLHMHGPPPPIAPEPEICWLTEELPSVRCEIAGALQMCILPDLCGESLEVCKAAVRTITHAVHAPGGIGPWHADWRLEAVYALSRLLPPADLLPCLVPLIRPPESPRVQFKALMGIYDAGVRAQAPQSEAWCAAARASGLELELLTCIHHWYSFGISIPLRRPAEDGGGRYALSEALRCVGRFCSEAAAMETLRIADLQGKLHLCQGPGWRERFVRFMERRRRCPITSPTSPF